MERLTAIVPFTLAIILFLLYLNFRNGMEVLVIVTTLPLALVGGMLSVALLTPAVIPAAYLLWQMSRLECVNST